MLVIAALFPMSCRAGSSSTGGTHDRWAALRQRMVDDQLRGRDIRDARVLAAMGEVPRHAFVPPAVQSEAYEDYPLAIGGGQTISQPYIVALMTQLLDTQPTDVVLEVGTGSGYQAAVLATLVREVYSIEIDPELAQSAAERLAAAGYRNVHVRSGDGFLGWPDKAPFDAIIVTAAAPRVPEPLIAQLREGGRIVIPLAHNDGQRLVRGVKVGDQLRSDSAADVLFVPMRGLVLQTRPPGSVTPQQ
jgi:protein-L-isoaspartate(D-aspartate) O-methyltransferase